MKPEIKRINRVFRKLKFPYILPDRQDARPTYFTFRDISKRIFLFLCLIGLFIIPSPVFAEGGLKIAIVDFEPGSTNASAEKITYKIKSELIKSGNFDVISSKTVKKALDELEINDVGIFNTNQAMKLGQKLNADLVLMGEVTNFDVDKSTINPDIYINRVRVGRMYSITVKLDISARLVHVPSGAVLFSEMFSGYSHRESHDVSYNYVNIDLGDPDSDAMMKKVFNEAMEKLTSKIIDVAPKTGYILSVEEGLVVIDLGQKRQMKEGTVLQVYESRKYKHPKTGAEVTSNEKIAKIKVVKVLENISRAEVTEGNREDIQPGNMVLVVK